jgi:hypothetical protein
MRRHGMVRVRKVNCILNYQKDREVRDDVVTSYSISCGGDIISNSNKKRLIYGEDKGPE